jgi:transcription-repair coupling factor (superfamily II helicase)
MSAPLLSALPGLLAGEAVLAELLSADDASVVVPEAARALVLAALAELSTAPVILVATPTLREAEQLEHDLCAFVGRDRVDVLPAWETLPYERVSPASETMGRRLRAMWRLRHGAATTGAATTGAATTGAAAGTKTAWGRPTSAAASASSANGRCRYWAARTR